MIRLVNYIKRISVLLFIYFISRVCFLINNSSLFFESENFYSAKSIFLLLIESIRFDLSIILYINSLVFILIVMPNNFYSKLWYRKIIDFVFILCNIPFIVINNIDIEFFQFNQKRITNDFIDLMFLGNDFLQTLPSYTIEHWPILIVTSFQIYFLFKIKDVIPSRIKFNFNSISKSSLVFILASFIFIMGARGGTQLKPLKIINAGEISNPNFSSLILNTPFCFLHSFSDSKLENYNYFNSDDLNDIYNPKTLSSHKIMDKKNIIFIIMESLSKEFVGYHNNISLTPFLDSLSKHSLIFDNTFSNGLRSIEALPAITASIPTLSNNPFITSSYSQNNFNSMASLLNKKGYSTSFFHGGTKGTMGFYGYCKKAGFKSYYGMEEYDNNEDYDGTWGIYDEPFFNFFAKKLSVESQPFFSTFFSLSAHPPYNLPNKYLNTFKEGKLEIHKLIQYSDRSLKTFFNSIKNEEWFSNTVFVITADHTSPKSSDSNFKNKIGRYSIPMIFYAPSLSFNGVNSTITQQIDIMPTVLDLLNFEDDYFAFGESVFDKQGWAIHYNNKRFCLITDNGILNNLDTTYKNFSDWDLKKSLIVNTDTKRKLKAIKQVYSNSMNNNNLIVK